MDEPALRVSALTDAGDHDPTRRAIEFAARDSYGRLIALLSSRSRDVVAAEDALGDAFAAALAQWPATGVPHNPEGWLVATAKRRLSDGRRRAAVRDAAADALTYAASFMGSPSPADPNDGTSGAIPDRRLGLLFACAHPAIDAHVRTPLMLQAVLGFDAARIASAFMVAPTAMAQRLVRAKQKIRDAGIPLELCGVEQLAGRTTAVLEAIYVAFAAGWDAVAGGDDAAGKTDLSEEAIWLGRLVVDALPDDAEARGLLALMMYCHARRDARINSRNEYVPLADQDTSAWCLPMIGEAEAALGKAAQLKRPGRFQLEAAIQSAHLAPAFGRAPDWRSVAALYDALVVHAPTVGAYVNRAAAYGEAFGPEAGLQATDAIPLQHSRTYQPWWALRAHLFSRLGQTVEARVAFEMAAGLTQTPSVRSFLLARRDALGASGTT